MYIPAKERKKNIYISWGGPFFSLSGHIFRTLPFSIFGGDWKKKWGNTESKKKINLLASLSIPPNKVFHLTCVSGRALHGSFRRSGFSFSSLFFFLFSSLFFFLPLKLRFHTIIYSLPHSLVFLPHLVSVFPQSNLLREKREKIKIKKKMEKRNRRWWWWYAHVI